jgi:hypothetical protein
MSRIVIVILISYSNNPTDLIYALLIFTYTFIADDSGHAV